MHKKEQSGKQNAGFFSQSEMLSYIMLTSDWPMSLEGEVLERRLMVEVKAK